MTELYWITRFDNIHHVSVVLAILSGIVMAYAGIVCIAGTDKEDFRVALKMFKITLTAFITTILINVFVPTTKEAFVIYGVGGSIDYLKSNPTAQKLPEKYIEYLDKWVESKLEDVSN